MRAHPFFSSAVVLLLAGPAEAEISVTAFVTYDWDGTYSHWANASQSNVNTNYDMWALNVDRYWAASWCYDTSPPSPGQTGSLSLDPILTTPIYHGWSCNVVVDHCTEGQVYLRIAASGEWSPENQDIASVKETEEMFAY